MRKEIEENSVFQLDFAPQFSRIQFSNLVSQEALQESLITHDISRLTHGSKYVKRDNFKTELTLLQMILFLNMNFFIVQLESMLS